MKKYFFILLFFFIFFFGVRANALTQNGITLYNSGYQILGSVTQNRVWNSPIFIDNVRRLRFYISSPSFTGGATYTQYLNFTTQVPYSYVSSVNVSSCGLYVNGINLTDYTSQYYGRSSFECVNDGAEPCYIHFYYQMTRLFQTSQTSDLFIECELNSNYRTNMVSFIYTNVNEGDGTISAIENASQSDQNNNNSISDRTNATINSKGNEIREAIEDLQSSNESKSNSILGKIQDFMDSFASGVRSITSTISNGVVEIISSLSSLGSNIVSGVSNAISSGVSSVVNKIGELIGLNQVCTVYYKTNYNEVTYGEPGISNAYLNSSGQLVSSPYFNVSDFIFIPPNSGNIYLENNVTTTTETYYCVYSSIDSQPIACSTVPLGIKSSIYTNVNANRYIRFSYRTGYSLEYTLEGDCQKSGIFGIFNRLGQFINNFFSNALGLDRIGTILNKHKNILDNSAFDSLSDFIHSPINFIHSLESTSCAGLTLTVFSQNITLPSGCIFWSREDVSSFRDFWNLLFGGLLIYRMGYRLFKALNDSIDPTKDDLGGLEI